MSSTISTARGILLFASTIVGAGILALPVVASTAGFFPLAAMLVVMAAVSSFSGFYIAEAVLADNRDAHLPALAQRYLGTWGVAAMLLGIAVNIYGALIGYLAAGGQIFHTLSRGAIPVWLGTLLYFLIGSLILHRGIVLVSRINTYFMYVMLVLLGILIAMAAPSIQVPFLVRANWTYSFDVFGVVLFAYLGHSVIPSIVVKLGDKKSIATVIAAGTLLPCVLYLLWSMVVLGAVPTISDAGPSLSQAHEDGQPATIPLGLILGGSIIILGNVFAALSTLTSYAGFGVSLRDSYGDLAGQGRQAVPGWALTGLVVVPPLLVALWNPDAFVDTLDIAGAFGGGLFVGVLPVLILMQLRRRGLSAQFRTWGGNGLPWIILAVYVAGMLYTAARFTGAVP